MGLPKKSNFDQIYAIHRQARMKIKFSHYAFAQNNTQSSLDDLIYPTRESRAENSNVRRIIIRKYKNVTE